MWRIITHRRCRHNIEMSALGRRTSRILTKYERACLIGERVMQLGDGAEPSTDVGGETDSIRIAEMELRARTLPLRIRRFLPDGTHEDWSLADMFID